MRGDGQVTRNSFFPADLPSDFLQRGSVFKIGGSRSESWMIIMRAPINDGLIFTSSSQSTNMAALLYFTLRCVSSPICRFALDRRGRSWTGKPSRPSLSSKPEDISCVIQGPFMTAFPSAVALPNYPMIRWWGSRVELLKQACFMPIPHQRTTFRLTGSQSLKRCPAWAGVCPDTFTLR